jgi:alkylated DNA repair dioxygenase AlkB
VPCALAETANLVPVDGVLRLVPGAVPTPERVLERLLGEIGWRQDVARIMGRLVALPRLTAWHGDAGYRYSGIDNQPQPWLPLLLELKEVAETLAEASFNSVLLNLYRDGRDSMGWHSDDERSLGVDPVIASLSFGAVRRFRLKHKRTGESVALDLPPGSCLGMAGALQHHWRHALPKTARPVGPRVNLTFRQIRLPDQGRSAARVGMRPQ